MVLLSLVIMLESCVLLLLSHLSKMLFHDDIACELLIIVDSLTELDNISWINEGFKLFVPQFSHTLVFHVELLWIWIGHVEALLL